MKINIESAVKHLSDAMWSVKHHRSQEDIEHYIKGAQDCLDPYEKDMDEIHELEKDIARLKERCDFLEKKKVFNETRYGHVELLFGGSFGLHTETIAILNPKLRGLTYYGERYNSYRIFFNKDFNINHLSNVERIQLQQWLNLLNVGLRNED